MIAGSSAIMIGGIVYVLAMLAIGLLASRNVADAADFVVAGRRLPTWLCTFTLFATFFGGGTCIGAAGAAYSGGLLAVIADPFGAGLCLLLAGAFYVKYLRRLELMTVADYFRRRYSRSAEVLAAVCILPAYVGWVASQFYAFGLIVHTLTGVDVIVATLVGAGVVLVYTGFGGMWAVSVTDFVQGLVLIVGILVLVPFVLRDVGGVASLVDRAPDGAFDMLPQSSLKDWLWYVQAWLVIGIGNIPGQDLFQRALSARDERTAVRSAYIAGAMYFTVGMVPVILGIAGAIVMPGIADPEQILPTLALRYLHPVAMAVFVGALFSALMSSADSALLAPASVFGQNILRDALPGMSAERLLAAIRWSVLLFGLLGLVTALAFQAVYDLMVNSWSGLMVTLFTPLTLGLYWKRTNSIGACTSIIVGLVSWLFLSSVQQSYPSDLIATVIGVLVLVVVSSLTQQAASEPERV